MYFLYSVLQLLGAVVAFPYLAYKAIAHKSYVNCLGQRLGFLPAEVKSDGRKTVWIHSCSVGETLAAQPIAFHLHKQFPEARMVISTITATGQAVARARFASYADAFYFPYDVNFIVKRSLDHIQPDFVVIMETEIWPHFLRECARRRIPVILANGRISETSFRRYRLVTWFMRRALADFSLLIMQSEEDAKRIKAIGAPQDKVFVSGNIKYDRDGVERDHLNRISEKLDRLLGLSQAPLLIVAGSTHSGEEALLLDALRRVRQDPDLNGTRLLIAPRHPERFDDVAKLIERSGFRFVRRSQATSGDMGDVILLDSIGELAATYRFARVVFVGGTLVPKGGQSIIEPAFYAKPILIGPHMDHFHEILSHFVEHGALVQLPGGSDDELRHRLTDTLTDLLKNKLKCDQMGRRAQAVLEQNRGAISRTAEHILPLVAERMVKR